MTDRFDQPLSSEELIARAREDLSEREPPEREVRVPAYAAPEARVTAHPPQAGPAAHAPADPFGEPVLGGSPPPAFPDAAARPPVRSQPSALAGAWARRGWLIGLVFAGFMVYTVFFDHSKAVETLEPGDCFDDPGVDTVYEVDAIDCDGPHDYEVFATVVVGADGAAFPGDDALFLTAFERCLDHFEAYTAKPWETSVYYLDSMVPTPEGWGEGDREATCVLFSVDAAEENVVKSTGSARGRGI